jgi:hypothetical protein
MYSKKNSNVYRIVFAYFPFSRMLCEIQLCKKNLITRKEEKTKTNKEIEKKTFLFIIIHWIRLIITTLYV